MAWTITVKVIADGGIVFREGLQESSSAAALNPKPQPCLVEILGRVAFACISREDQVYAPSAFPLFGVPLRRPLFKALERTSKVIDP